MRSSNPIMILLCLPEKQIIFASQYFSSFPWVERTSWRQNIQRWDEKCFWLRLCCLRSNDYVCANDGNCRSEGATICAAPGWLSFNNFPFPFANNIIVFIPALLVTQANDVIVRGFDKTISLLNISNFFQHNTNRSQQWWHQDSYESFKLWNNNSHSHACCSWCIILTLRSFSNSFKELQASTYTIKWQKIKLQISGTGCRLQCEVLQR